MGFGNPSTADRDSRVDIVVPAEEFRDKPNRDYGKKSLLICVTPANPQSAGHFSRGIATISGSATATSGPRDRAHFTRQEHVYFNQCGFKLTTLAVEKLRGPRKWRGGTTRPGSYHRDGEPRGGGSYPTQNGLLLKRTQQIISVTKQIAISRRDATDLPHGECQKLLKTSLTLEHEVVVACHNGKFLLFQMSLFRAQFCFCFCFWSLFSSGVDIGVLIPPSPPFFILLFLFRFFFINFSFFSQWQVFVPVRMLPFVCHSNDASV